MPVLFMPADEETGFDLEVFESPSVHRDVRFLVEVDRHLARQAIADVLMAQGLVDGWCVAYALATPILEAVGRGQ